MHPYVLAILGGQRLEELRAEQRARRPARRHLWRRAARSASSRRGRAGTS